MSACLAKKNGGARSAFPLSRMCSRELRPTDQVRRTGEDFASPTTGSDGWGGTGMTKEVAVIKQSRGWMGKIALFLRVCDRRRQSGSGRMLRFRNLDMTVST